MTQCTTTVQKNCILQDKPSIRTSCNES